MGIALHWEDENGNRLGELLDISEAVQKFLPDCDTTEFPCLRFVDPYGDTVFNRLQIPQLITELETLLRQKHEPEVDQHLRAVLDFVRQDHGVHTYLRFYGD
jgi:hypothetical protein